jgi:glycosyltransferase involved in cell wall biosynthesis
MKKIIHVTEALGGGPVHSISQLAKQQVLDGFEVILVHSLRPDTPPEALLDQLFPTPIHRIVVFMTTPISFWKDLSSMLQLMKIFRQLRPDIIHLHSSKAGVLGRVAAYLTHCQHRVFYSPRGFAFLRQDVSPLKRRLYLCFEQISAYFGGTLVACSGTEASFAKYNAGLQHVALVENSVSLEQIHITSGSNSDTLRVVTSGRICYQKAPTRFREIATQLLDEPANFVWIGDIWVGHGVSVDELLIDGALPTNLTITGWRNRQEVFDELAISDIFVLLSLWEGMPLALIEAQAAGLPAVVSDVIGCRDVVLNNVTGFICSSTDEAVEKVRLLIRDQDLRQRMSVNARSMALQRFSVQRMHQEMMAVYGFN